MLKFHELEDFVIDGLTFYELVGQSRYWDT